MRLDACIFNAVRLNLEITRKPKPRSVEVDKNIHSPAKLQNLLRRCSMFNQYCTEQDGFMHDRRCAGVASIYRCWLPDIPILTLSYLHCEAETTHNDIASNLQR